VLKWLEKLVDSNEKELKKLQPLVARINGLEPEYRQLSDAALRAKTGEFRARIADATANIRQRLSGAQSEPEKTRLEQELREITNKVLDDLLPEAFAAVREAARRTIGQRHHDVQLMGGIVLHRGKIAEMRTGEGKTLVATLPLYLNSLTGEGCHLVTVNDYLARRDPYWMGPIYHALGITVASIYPMQGPDEPTPSRRYDPEYDSGKENDRWRHFRPVSRKEAYRVDITYGTSSEFGFDYLRDNMVIDLARCVQRPLCYAIVDEVDNLLIDEARTPLIISAPDTEAGQLYQLFARLALQLTPGADYEIKAKERSAELTDDGWAKVERMLKREGVMKSDNLYDAQNNRLMLHLRNALSAREFYKRDQQYVVRREGGKAEIVIVDEFTGRLMHGRRYSEGLHQAIEAKEHVPVQQESKTYATITIQNYFRMYRKLAGMTGTALTEAEEFYKIYGLDVVVIPTNKPMVREDLPDRIYRTEAAKFRALVSEIREQHEQERPVLIGTVSIEKSEYLSDLLKRQGITCQVLNAKEHTREGEIIARAGEPGAVTVATNMAGRGVDIILGGSPEGQDAGDWQARHDRVINSGGLFILGTERHEARRIDNQLRGRAGRQGDPGSSRFYVSLEDDIMRRFGGDRIKGLMEWAGLEEDTPIENNLITRAITDVQKRVEGYHFDLRKHLVEYDDVVNQHREIIYAERRKVLGGADLKANILDMVSEEISSIVSAHIPDGHVPDRDIPGLLKDIRTIMAPPPGLDEGALARLSRREIETALVDSARSLYEQREREFGAGDMRLLERLIMLRVIDTLWVEHLTEMEHMRLEAGWQTLRQTKAVDAYRIQGQQQFAALEQAIRHDVAHTIFRAGIKRKPAPGAEESPMAQAAGSAGAAAPKTKAAGKKVGRNDPCPCGSGKKFKQCCGK